MCVCVNYPATVKHIYFIVSRFGIVIVNILALFHLTLSEFVYVHLCIEWRHHSGNSSWYQKTYQCQLVISDS